MAAAYITHPPVAPPETAARTLWIWIHVDFMISLLSGIFVLIALLVQYFRLGGGYLGFLGFALALISPVFVFGLDYSEVFIFPRPSGSIILPDARGVSFFRDDEADSNAGRAARPPR